MAKVYDGLIIDAHHHFWDPQRNHHPWLSGAENIPFRYGDYSAIKRPCQLSSVSARALAITPRNSGINACIQPCDQHNSSAPLRAINTRRL